MAVPGYSDRVNHALAFAAKHHDREVRKGTRAPYFTAPANVAVILTRYDCDEDTVVAGVLRHAVEDMLRDGASEDGVHERLADKFGPGAVEAVLHVARRRFDDDGVELSHEEQKHDVLDRLSGASGAARWAFAAHELHDAATLLADLRRTSFPDAVWQRVAEGAAARVRWYGEAAARLAGAGFHAGIVDELRAVSTELGTHTPGHG
ncbi:MAG TPA: HD domain-containing protein [Gemmatirosa sp.]